MSNIIFLHPPENARSLCFSDIFRGYRNGTLVQNGLTIPVVGETGKLLWQSHETMVIPIRKINKRNYSVHSSSKFKWDCWTKMIKISNFWMPDFVTFLTKSFKERCNLIGSDNATYQEWRKSLHHFVTSWNALHNAKKLKNSAILLMERAM